MRRGLSIVETPGGPQEMARCLSKVWNFQRRLNGRSMNDSFAVVCQQGIREAEQSFARLQRVVSEQARKMQRTRFVEGKGTELRC